MYAATFHNVFLSRRSFLGGPASVTEGQVCTATKQVDIPAAGIYAPLVRFEAAYRFETMYRVEVEQCAPTPHTPHNTPPLPQFYMARLITCTNTTSTSIIPNR